MAYGGDISRETPLVNEVNYYCRFYIDYKISSNDFEAMTVYMELIFDKYHRTNLL